MDGQAYEDTLREMFGIHAYISFTLDKVCFILYLKIYCISAHFPQIFDIVYVNEKKMRNTPRTRDYFWEALFKKYQF